MANLLHAETRVFFKNTNFNSIDPVKEQWRKSKTWHAEADVTCQRQQPETTACYALTGVIRNPTKREGNKLRNCK